MDFTNIDVSVGQRAVRESRTCQHDTDFSCYHAANLDESVQQNFKHLLRILEQDRLKTGSGKLNSHITLGSKGGRNEIATVKPYQEDRKTSPTKDRVKVLRNMLANWVGTARIAVVANLQTEADDSMTVYQTDTVDVLDSIIYSGDKDLRMTQGLHWCSWRNTIVRVDGFGRLRYEDTGNKAPKLIGYGTCWFWYQMLAGDGVDNIPGLERVTGEMLERFKQLTKKNPKRKEGACGEKTALLILDGANDDAQAFNRVALCYKAYYGNTWKHRMIEQAFLLWMRRTNDPWDALVFLEEVSGLEFKPSQQQEEAITKWKFLMECMND